jgi:hypothetical protein
MTNNITAGSIVTVRPEQAITSRLRNLVGKHLTVDRESPTGGAVIISGLAGGWVSKTRLELVRTPDEIKVGTFIISLQKEDGTLLPAAEPKKYSTDSQAHKIAEMMAAKHGGKFLVFRAIGEYEMPQAKPTFRVL